MMCDKISLLYIKLRMGGEVGNLLLSSMKVSSIIVNSYFMCALSSVQDRKVKIIINGKKPKI